MPQKNDQNFGFLDFEFLKIDFLRPTWSKIGEYYVNLADLTVPASLVAGKKLEKCAFFVGRLFLGLIEISNRCLKKSTKILDFWISNF